MPTKYSPTEEELLKMLPTGGDKRISSNKLAERYYANRKKVMPRHGRIYINSSMRTLMEKARTNRVKIRRSDHKPYEFWIAS
jgi:hypothetical protein